MFPLLSFHAIAAQRGDGLHPVLLEGLKRLSAERAELATTEPTTNGTQHVCPTCERLPSVRDSSVQQATEAAGA